MNVVDALMSCDQQLRERITALEARANVQQTTIEALIGLVQQQQEQIRMLEALAGDAAAAASRANERGDEVRRLLARQNVRLW